MLERLRDSLRNSNVIDINGYPYFVHPITDGIPLTDPDILDEITDAIMETGLVKADIIVTPEVMGIPIATAVSLRTRVPYSVIRKRRYGLSGETRIIQHTGYSTSEMFINGVGRGDRVLVIDDVLSTGGTLRSIVTALRDVIGADVLGAVMVIGKNDSRNISEELGIPVVTLLRVDIVNGHVTVS